MRSPLLSGATCLLMAVAACTPDRPNPGDRRMTDPTPDAAVGPAPRSATAPPAATATYDGQHVTLTHTGGTLAVSLRPPRLVFAGEDAVVPAAGAAPLGGLDPGRPRELPCEPVVLSDGARLDVVVVVEWSPDEGVLRKWARLRLAEDAPARLLEEVVLEELAADERSFDVLSEGVQSYPAYTDGFFTGIEYPIAATRLVTDDAGRRLLLAHRPGARLVPGEWYTSRKAVVGVAPRGREKRAFERYVAAHRPEPRGLHVNYNSWWTAPIPRFTEDDIVGLMREFEARLFRPHGVSFDTFCLDMGWSHPESIWEIDTRLFPTGFDRIARAVAEQHAALGLWISPSSHYAPALDNDWAASAGFETFVAPWGRRYPCLAGPRYRTAFTEHLVDHITRYGIRHVKFDGYQFVCHADDHGHAPGPLSAEACAAGIIAVFDAVRAAAPDLWLEPTCFGFNPSPWWVFHANSVIGTFGDDAPRGRVPCPVYRETYTTSRDFWNLQGANLMSLPSAAQEVLGIIHQTPDPFMNDAVMTLVRGHRFLPLYINPKYMDERRWQDLADFLKWARANEARFGETEVLLPPAWQDGRCPRIDGKAPAPREPYGYAHWSGDRGLIALRNPWIAPARYAVSLAELPPGVTVSAVSVYPEPRLYGRGLTAAAGLDVPLGPYETVVLVLEPGTPPAGLPDASAALETGVAVRIVRGDAVLARFTDDATGIDGSAEYGPDWTSDVGGVAAVTRISGEAEITVPGPGSELSLLREGDDPLVEPLHRVTIDGVQVAPTATATSATGWAHEAVPPEQWLFLRYPLPAGRHVVTFELYGRSAQDRLSAWVWTTRPGRAGAPRLENALPEPELVSLGAVRLADTGGTTPPAVEQPRPVSRIDGVYLDALAPTTAQADYGTLQRNRNVVEKPLRIGETRYLRGLGTHAQSRLVYALGGRFERFQAWVGPEATGNPTVSFTVRVDGATVWESGLMRKGDAAQRVDVDVRGAETLELQVGDGGDGITSDWANWADAVLLH